MQLQAVAPALHGAEPEPVRPLVEDPAAEAAHDPPLARAAAPCRPEIRPEAELRSDSCQRPRWRTTRTFESRGTGATAAGEGEVAVTYAVAGREVRPRRSVATYCEGIRAGVPRGRRVCGGGVEAIGAGSERGGAVERLTRDREPQRAGRRGPYVARLRAGPGHAAAAPPRRHLRGHDRAGELDRRAARHVRHPHPGDLARHLVSLLAELLSSTQCSGFASPRTTTRPGSSPVMSTHWRSSCAV